LKDLTASSEIQSIPDGSQVNFQVQTQIGHIDGVGVSLGMGNIYSFTGETSDWSSTQTITVPVSSSSPTPIAIGSLALTLAISFIVVIIALVITLLLHRRHRKTANVLKVI
jgi:hypothetical protein